MSNTLFPSRSADLSALRRWLKARPERLVPLTLQEITLSTNVLDELPERAARSRADRPASFLIMDRTPMHRNGVLIKPQMVSALRARLGDLKVIELGQPDDPPHADFHLVSELSGQLKAGSLMITIGSGTITDLAKHAMFLIEKEGGARFEHICCPTACTVTAFTASMTVLTMDGVKRTMRSRSPDRVLVDLAMIRDAPVELTRAGVGDLLARCTAYGDWYLGDLFGVDESFNTVPFDLMFNAERRLLEQAEAIGRRDLGGLDALADALMLAGIGMSIVDQTTPISGWEHVMSHYLDLRAMAAHRPVGLHGAQVGAATLIAAKAFEEIISAGTSFWDRPAPTFDMSQARRQIEEHFRPLDRTGGMIEELWREYGVKAQRIAGAMKNWPRVVQAWKDGTALRQLQQYVRPASVVAGALTQAQAVTNLVESSGTTDPEPARSAVLCGHLVRNRFTLGDILSLFGALTPSAVQRWMA